MTSDTTKPGRQDEAARWFAAERAGAMLVGQRQEFDAWRADPRNQAALDAMRELWDDLAVLKASTPAARKPARRGLVRLAAAAAFVVLGGAALSYLFSSGAGTTISTGIGQQEIQSMPDGSLIAVNVASSLSYRINQSERIVMLSDGEAAFTVKADPQKPFIVRTGDIEIRAIGTTFNVRQRGDGIEVAVSEGVVEVCRISAGGGVDVLSTLSAGQLIAIPPASQSTVAPALPVPVPPDRVAEWRMRVVTYEDASVEEVVEDFNRYFERKLRVERQDLLDRRVTIRLRVDDRERAIGTLASLLDASVGKRERIDYLR